MLSEEEQERVKYWAERICMYPEDIYNREEEEILQKVLGNEELKNNKEFKRNNKAVQKLECYMEESFTQDFEEECACTDVFIELLRDYGEATPAERAVINFILRRLANTTVAGLLPPR